MLKKLSQVRVRWWIFTLMFLVGFVAYLQQKTLTIAAASMEPDLSLSQLQISWLRAAFIMGYAFFQFPAGVIGEYLGARRTFTLAGLLAIGAMMAMPVVPSVLHGNSLFIAMMLSQGLLGISQSVVWPVSAGVLSRWFPSSQWAFILGLQTMSLSIASMITPPLISHLMTSHSWQHAFFIAALPAIPLVLIWGWYGRNSPQEHTAVSAQELQELDVVEPTTGHSQPQTPLSHRIVKLLKNKNILLLTFSYLTMNYVFYLVGDWCFLYLAQERHFSILESGWLAALPPMGAAIGAGVGGIITTLLCVRLGQRWGLRLMPLITLPWPASFF